MAKINHGFNRTRRVAFRLSEKEYERAEARRVRSNSKTLSAYARASMLTGMEFEVPAWEYLRILTNAMVENTNELRKLGLTKATEAKAVAAYDAVSRIGTPRI